MENPYCRCKQVAQRQVGQISPTTSYFHAGTTGGVPVPVLPEGGYERPSPPPSPAMEEGAEVEEEDEGDPWASDSD